MFLRKKVHIFVQIHFYWKWDVFDFNYSLEMHCKHGLGDCIKLFVCFWFLYIMFRQLWHGFTRFWQHRVLVYAVWQLPRPAQVMTSQAVYIIKIACNFATRGVSKLKLVFSEKRLEELYLVSYTRWLKTSWS